MTHIDFFFMPKRKQYEAIWVCNSNKTELASFWVWLQIIMVWMQEIHICGWYVWINVDRQRHDMTAGSKVFEMKHWKAKVTNRTENFSIASSRYAHSVLTCMPLYETVISLALFSYNNNNNLIISAQNFDLSVVVIIVKEKLRLIKINLQK